VVGLRTARKALLDETMHPFERSPPGPPPGVKPSLQVLLKEGWRLDARRRSFTSPEGEQRPLRGVLPAGARVVPLAPALAEAEPADLSDPERYLARQVQIIFPQGAQAADYADALRDLDAVEDVRVPPQVALP
jgi:hypothetical protein